MIKFYEYYIYIYIMFEGIKKTFSKVLGIKGKKQVMCLQYLTLAVAVAAVYYVYQRTTSGQSIFEGLSNGKKTLVLFHMKGCGHCVKLMPEWDAFEKENNSNIQTKKLEQSEAGDLLQKHGIGGFPTIMLLDHNNNKVADYEGARSKSGLLDFCKKYN